MSLILEALRKSETERRRGQVPDLFVELPPTAHRRGRALAPWHWLLLALVVCAALAWLLRERWTSSPAPATAPVADAAVPSTQKSIDDAQVQPAEPDPADAMGDSAIASPNTIPVTPIPALPTPPAATSQPADAPAPAPVQAPMPVATEIVPPPAQVPIAIPAEPSRPVSQPVPTQPKPTVAPTPRNDVLLELADLTAEQRRQLPPLKLSMHLWNQDPSQRFVIIDGARLGEGDRIGTAVIDRITVDSVILDWNGRLLRLPLR